MTLRREHLSGTSQPMRIVGYADRPSVAPSETISVCVSCSDSSEYRARVVRLIHADMNPEGPGYKEEPVATEIDGTYAGRWQTAKMGSYGIVNDDSRLTPVEGLTLQAFICPTRLSAQPQAVLARWSIARDAGYALALDPGGHVAFYLGDGRNRPLRLRMNSRVTEGEWYLVAASYDPTAKLARLYCRHEHNVYANRLGGLVAETLSPSEVTARVGPLAPYRLRAPLTIGAAGLCEESGTQSQAGWHFNGKIDRPLMLRGAQSPRQVEAITHESTDHPSVVAAWDFAASITDAGIEDFDRAVDVSQNGLHARLVNAPTRGVTGHNWTGRTQSYVHVPQEYSAIHFHEDDIVDAGWDADLTLAISPSFRSGIYAIHLSTSVDEEHHEDYIPFVVRPPLGEPSATAALLLPTATYLAYGNERTLPMSGKRSSEATTGSVPVLGKEDLARHIHPEWGASTYDTHLDGTGICYAGWRRPLTNIRPKYHHSTSRVRQLNADLHLVDWLEHVDVRVDVVTDHDLHRYGAPLLAPYRVVLTGTHPEYYSEAMLDALARYVTGGGRLMYLGGNGFYWVVAFSSTDANVMEVRRAEGSQSWESPPGERHLSFTGEPGGTWRSRHRPPNKLVGVGNIAQGLDRSSYYMRRSDSKLPETAWIFDGVESDVIGNFGLAGGGAAGLEIDCFDPHLGSPDETYVLASSVANSSLMLEVRENLDFTQPFAGGATNPRVHADVTYFKTRSGGAVFSTGSIAWCGSLSSNNYTNGVSQITENVLMRFNSLAPLP
jgi:N,N-dimethylformamidase